MGPSTDPNPKKWVPKQKCIFGLPVTMSIKHSNTQPDYAIFAHQKSRTHSNGPKF